MKFVMDGVVKIKLIFLIAIVSLWSCKKDTEQIEPKATTLFSKVESIDSNITFTNSVKEDLYFNFINYPYVYNGGGVAVGDINNDGLVDVYFTSNQESNKLYLNQADFKFKDITESARVSDAEGWTTGVSMIDINNDGYLDIYVCKSGSLQSHDLRKNKLFINQKNNTFKESAAEYGLDHYGFSVQAYFFDADLDGDLDMYLVNHRQDFRNNTKLDKRISSNIQDYSSDQFFRNENGKFINRTKEAGLLNKAWGLSASIGDFNNDNLPDIYVANDFLEPDFLYVNQGNGTFKEELKKSFKHISNNSMGSDYADINNDLKPDLVVLDMMAEDHIRGKENMATMSTSNFWSMVDFGNHYQYMSNMLQLNNADGTYSDIGQLAGIAKTDWSWAPLLADFDNDGYNDLFITNGIEKDLSNQDFRSQMKQNIINRKKVKLEEAIDMMPSSKLSNYVFKNNKDYTFINTTQDWGLTEKVNSNGAAYADLDNDGDLDLIVNNQSEKAHIYKNNATNNFVSFSFEGNENNKNGIGVEVKVYVKGLSQTKINYISRGFQSSVNNCLNFGLDTIQKIDSITVVWPSGLIEKLINTSINKNHILKFSNAKLIRSKPNKKESLFEDVVASEIGIDFQQKENNFNDYDMQLLLPQKQSEISNCLVVGDINNDGLDDFFVGNSLGEKASLYMQQNGGSFKELNKQLFEKDKKYEDTHAEFLDIDNDGDLDLFVTSGGYEIKEHSALLEDRLYLNDGKGIYKRDNSFPEIFSNSNKVSKGDFDNDGDIDLFITSRVLHGKYPLADKPILLENRKGEFIDVTEKMIKDVSGFEMINDAVFTDFDNDSDLDLLIVGEWMSVILLENINNEFVKKDLPSLENKNGWYQSITILDFNNDGFEDYLIGNYGLNNKFHPTFKKPLHLYAGYMDSNSSFDVVLSKESKTGKLLPLRGKECSTQQVPSLQNKVKSFKEFASLDLNGIYGKSNLNNSKHLKTHLLETILLRNNKGKGFQFVKLPKQVQFGPVLGAEVLDLNNDGYLDIVGVGNVFEAEVETIRYDASNGFVLYGNENENFEYQDDYSGFNNFEGKTLAKIIINGERHVLVLNKNELLKIVKIKKANK
jgi:hypothetical protein